MRSKSIALEYFKILSDETRLKIFLKIIELSSYASLGDEPIVAKNHHNHLVKIFGLAKSTVSHHLSVLEKSGLVKIVKKKRFKYLYPDLNKFKEFNKFFEDNIQPFIQYSSYIKIGEVFANKSSSNSNRSFKEIFIDYLKINDCYAFENTLDISGFEKFYFKINTVNEPLNLIFKDGYVEIFCMEKNSQNASDKISSIVKNFYK